MQTSDFSLNIVLPGEPNFPFIPLADVACGEVLQGVDTLPPPLFEIFSYISKGALIAAKMVLHLATFDVIYMFKFFPHFSPTK